MTEQPGTSPLVEAGADPAPPGPDARKAPAPEAPEAKAAAPEAPEAGGALSGERPPRRGRLALVMGAAVGVAAAVVAGMLAFSGSDDPPDGDPVAPGDEPREAPEPSASNLTSYRDADGRFTLDYPKAWLRVPLDEPRVAAFFDPPPDLLVASRNLTEYLTVRITPLAQPVDTANLEDLKAVTDGAVGLGAIEILAERPITLENGLSGYFYLYTFEDEASGQQGVHSHNFLFQGSTMYQLIFQAIPLEDFAPLADTFDVMLQSFQPADAGDGGG